MPRRVRRGHLVSALIVAAFLIAHVGNHVVGLSGQDQHTAYMAGARGFYRTALIEPLLLMLLAWQVGSGLLMVARTWSTRRGGVAWLQALSGIYLALFLVFHVSAIVYGRTALGLDTDFRFAAAGFHVSPWQWFFAPYYFLAAASLFAHVGCAAYWNLNRVWASRRRWLVLAAFIAVGLTAGLLFDLALAGKLYPVDIPSAYRATFTGGLR